MNKLFAPFKRLSSTRRKVLSNVAWAMAGKAVSMVGVLFVGILVGRYLGPEKYGLMNYVISYVAIFEILAAFGLDNIEIRELSRHSEDRDAIMGTCFGLRLIFACVAYLAIAVFLWRFESDSYTIKMILAYALHLFVIPFNLARNYFTSIVQNKYVVQSQILRTILGAGIKVALLWLRAPLTYFILAAAFDFFLLAGGYAAAYQKKAGHLRDWRFEWERVSFLLCEAFPLLLSGAAVIIYQRIDQVIIKKMLNSAEVGYFATAGLFVGVVLFLPSVLVQTITPLLVRLRVQNPSLYEQRKREMMDVVVWSALGVSLVVCVLASPLIRWTYGVAYAPAVPVLQVLIWKTAGMSLATSSGQIIIIEGLQKWVVVRNLLGCALCVGGNLILIPRLGILGSAWATIVTVLGAGWFAHLLVPAYRPLFGIQCHSLLSGWKTLGAAHALFFSRSKNGGARA